MDTPQDGLIIQKNGKLFDLETAKDVTHHAPTLLFEPCRLDEDVTLKDIFLLIQHHIDVFEKILGNWCREFTTEALSTPSQVEDLLYLELYYTLQVEDGALEGINHPNFHGVGQDSPYSLSFLPLNKLADLPVKLGPAQIEQSSYPTLYTLGNILNGILWELSFYGPPAQRDQLAKEVNTSLISE